MSFGLVEHRLLDWMRCSGFTSLKVEYTVRLRKAIEKVFAVSVNPRHATSSPADDIHTLAFELARDLIKLYEEGGRLNIKRWTYILSGLSEWQPQN